ncbi:major facilitator superfamily domain-containing protein, partial [Absidia repens]
IGIMQDHLEQSQYGTGSEAVLQLSIVVSVADSLLNLLSIVAQILLSKFDLRTVMFMAGMLCTLGLELASLNTEIWHLIISIGIIFGSGSSVFFYASNVLIPQWLHKKQGIALGIVSCGGCIGGCALPFIMTSLNHSFGSKWCFRVLGFICFVTFSVAALLLKDKKKRQPQKIKDIVDFSVLKNKNLLIWCLADNIIEAAFYVPYFFVPSHATSLGLSDTKTSIIISLSFAVSGLGRIAAGHIGDRIGYINVTIISCVIASLSSFLMWTLANDFVTLLAFACVYGLTAGVFQSLGASITNVVEKDKFESAYTIFLILTAISFYGLNVVAVIEAPNFLTAKIFTGLAYFVGALNLLYLKSRLSDQFFLSRL